MKLLETPLYTAALMLMTLSVFPALALGYLAAIPMVAIELAIRLLGAFLALFGR